MHEMTYPETPGHRFIDTSMEAAAAIAPKCGRLQRMVLGAITEAGATGITTDEIAMKLNIDRGSVQPRTSELRLMGLIVDSKQRRRNASGVRAIVWTLPEYVEASDG
ncbi:hypothetical protein [Rhizorhabdus sp.]|jgi:DNA-binding MarR family transcriptional regulator|uniref:hypothetical protein n=1 Tax=Rhizorhabdus sp. TaxID=1968843 RepID=UPI0019B2DC97|nr:hypothetical protein [Rhizorhabdus sp.]MBD3761469.1 hypothetical protein [Rhizorhabdus sp.]